MRLLTAVLTILKWFVTVFLPAKKQADAQRDEDTKNARNDSRIDELAAGRVSNTSGQNGGAAERP